MKAGYVPRFSRVERLLHDSRLPLEKSWQTLDLKRLPPKVVQQARTLLEGSFLDRCENVLVFGQPGSGKTHLLSAIGQELVRAGRKVLFRKCGLLVQELLAAAAEACGADLVVMGAYGHSRIREVLFGGCTQAFISKADKPILLMH